MSVFFVDIARDDDGDHHALGGRMDLLRLDLLRSRALGPFGSTIIKHDLKRNLRTIDGFLSAPELTAIRKPVESFYLIPAVRKPTGFPFAAPDTKAASGSGSCTEANPGVRRLMYVLCFLHR